MPLCGYAARMAHATAAVLVIGDEILSGRTRDANAHLAAKRLFARGCRLLEISVVPDRRAVIAGAIRRLRTLADAVITSGGIGPTHDDVTMEALAEAMGVPLVEHAETIARMRARFGEDWLTPARRRMARLPAGARPIVCAKTFIPGAAIGGVYALAGVPEIFASQLEAILPEFGDGRPFLREEIPVALPESSFAEALAALQARHPEVQIGSYPQRCGQHPCGSIVLTARDPARLAAARAELESLLASLGR